MSPFKPVIVFDREAVETFLREPVTSSAEATNADTILPINFEPDYEDGAFLYTVDQLVSEVEAVTEEYGRPLWTVAAGWGVRLERSQIWTGDWTGMFLITTPEGLQLAAGPFAADYLVPDHAKSTCGVTRALHVLDVVVQIINWVGANYQRVLAGQPVVPR